MRRAQPPAPIVLTRMAGDRGAARLLPLPVLLGFLLPAAFLPARGGRARLARGFDPDLVRAALDHDPARRRRDRRWRSCSASAP